MQLELSGQEVFIGFGIISMVLILLIGALRIHFKSKPPKIQQEAQYQLSKRVKYASVDVFRHTKRLFGLALSISLLTVICGFSWTTYDRSNTIISGPMEIDDFIDMEPPIIPPVAPKPPPPAPPVIEEVPIEEIEEDQDDLDDAYIDSEMIIDEPLPEVPTAEATPPPSPPPPAPINEDVDPIFKVVEQMPLFGGCKDQICSERALFKFLYKHLRYPAIAQENGVQGKVFVQFVVERDGSITDFKIVRDAGAGLGKESMRVIQKINELPKAFEPGRQRGVPVRVLFTLPVTFKLTN